ncbi:protein-disulfide reductase DsbD domain-containing protein [Kaistia granuli]|uniref:protein-disulfide reductase DsbD domain-containing protein n=1 Tax=Kaistia granuli TaxID=363259 RepID=UPI000382021B|nr:protein-disulfide reductase DsbD domain-containing protein [Kaistia granuli]
MQIRNLTAALVLVFSGAPALATTGPWVAADNVRVRLVATAPEADGSLHGAIEIKLEPGWKTYWRSPGDAGVPPRFDFSDSVNAREATVSFPAPERDDDGYAASNVYRDRVVLPVHMTVAEPGKPVRLDVVLDIGVCEDICIPVNLRARLELSADPADEEGAPIIAAARAALPGPGRPGEFELKSLRRVGGPDKKPEFEVEFAAANPSEAVLFVETPGDWYADPPKAVAADGGRSAFRFAVDRKSASGAIGGAEIRLTLTEGKVATSRTFKLDGDGVTP